MPYTSIRGFQLYFEEHGSGPSVLTAHGMLGSVATATVMNATKLAAHGLHVVAYDARGHGLSGYTERCEDYSWHALAEDTHQLLNALGIERAAVCGTSMGAGVALMLALTQPTRVERLILRCPPPFAQDLRPARRRMNALASMCRYLGVPLTAGLVGILPGAADTARLVSTQRRAALLPLISGLLFDGAPIPSERLGEIQAPTLVFGHRGDAMHPLRSGELIRDSIPGASLHVVDSAQHWKKNPDDFCNLAASFIKAGYPGPRLVNVSQL